MADLQALLEAERRGILPEAQKSLLDEARRRGLVTAPEARAGLASRVLQQRPSETAGAPFGVRARVGAVTDPADRLATLRQFFPSSVQDPLTGRLVFENPETGEVAFMNPQGFDVGDIPSLTREGFQFAGGGVGAMAGAPGGIPGAIGGAAVGTMAGEELFNFIARMTSTVDTRTAGERALETGTLGAFGGAGQGLGSLVGAGLRGAFRGGGRLGQPASAVSDALDDLARFETSPSLAQATESQFLDGLESIISRTPGGAGRFRQVVADTTDQVQKSLEAKVTQLTGREAVDPEFVGRTVLGGLEEGFTGRFNQTADELFGRIGIAPEAQVGTSNTAQAIADLNLIPEAPALNALVTSPTVRSIAQGAPGGGSNVAPGVPASVPFEVLKRMRSAVGRRISSPSLVNDIPTADLKQIYAAISRDMEEAARAAGPDAFNAFTRANRYYRAGLGRIDDTLQKLVNKATPEGIFRQLERGAKEGPTQVRSVMRSLNQSERNILAGGIIRRLGRAVPGQQDATGQAFSFETFLTNWNRLDGAAKEAMFNWPGLKRMKGDLDALARASARMRESSRAFFNPSGTAGAGVGQAATVLGGGSALLGIATGQTSLFVLPAIMAMSAMGANATARLMTNPHFVRWLAQSTKISPKSAGSHFGRLAAVAAASEDKEPILRYAEVFRNTAPRDQSGDR